ncbi:hypothetical protein Patl1_30045 [Pistacia atlantica]|uniref:Uncharacterized protein n=1 Tax=Pistacia atlantica TaxID=434234 RepID=A0ACC1AAE8_9ROSI|nr:hypothetical protein Patl1_30045 [Pistacia atlantica]
MVSKSRHLLWRPWNQRSEWLHPYCSGCSISPSASNENSPQASWSTERLISVDHVQRSLSYEIVDNNIGFKSYVSTVKIVPEDNEGENQSGCVIEWGFTVDPMEGWALDV